MTENGDYQSHETRGDLLREICEILRRAREREPVTDNGDGQNRLPYSIGAYAPRVFTVYSERTRTNTRRLSHIFVEEVRNE